MSTKGGVGKSTTTANLEAFCADVGIRAQLIDLEACEFRYALWNFIANGKWGGKGFESSIGGQTAQIPVWWALIHSLSKGITAAATAAIPCNPDIRQMMIELDEARIPNKLLLQEVADFSHD
ncbi:MAG: hypothetical protein FWC42_08910, partial [Proteobacteria bacterium]|nr:hypothetical protein [Pseudomonadota bacterium]